MTDATAGDAFLLSFVAALEALPEAEQEQAKARIAAVAKGLASASPEDRALYLAEGKAFFGDAAQFMPRDAAEAARLQALILARGRGSYPAWTNGRAERALEDAGSRSGAYRACRHVQVGGPAINRGGALLCVDHPQQGVRCEPCHNEHPPKLHTDRSEHTCDRCGDVVEVIASAVFAVAGALKVKVYRKPSRYVPGGLIVVGFGLCLPYKAIEDEQGGSR